ncbi:thioredoxin family protein [Burkholderiaceae bacterium UC74_6]
MPDQPLVLLACLCAAWCRVCDEYRPIFERLTADLDGVQVRWIDIEDEAEVLGDLDIETFPTLLIAGPDGVRFAGPTLPQEEVLSRLLAHTLTKTEAGAQWPSFDAEFAELAKRLSGSAA